MNVNTIKDAIISSVSKYEGQPITETILIKIQQDLYDLAKPIGKAGSITLEYTDENGNESFLDYEQWKVLMLFLLLCLQSTPKLTVVDKYETYSVTDRDIINRLTDDDFYLVIGKVRIFLKGRDICMKRA